jgi:hypothetical protein
MARYKLTKVAYIDTEGTFRPDRIRSIAERFGVSGDAALENILYGESTCWTHATLRLTSDQSEGIQQRASG